MLKIAPLILSRLLSAIPTLFILLLITFSLMRIAPGGPFDTERVLAPEIEANLKATYHLDKSIPIQFWEYLKQLARLDLGPSFSYKDHTVNELIASGFPTSLQLGLQAIFLAVVLGIFIGSISAYNQNTKLDYAFMSFAMIGISIPNFVIAPIFILTFAILIPVFPAGGWQSSAFVYQVLPTLTLALPQIAYVSRLMRASMLEILRSNFIQSARAKGLSTPQILIKHALKPACIPIISYLGPAIAGITTGSVVIEQIFGIPGLGRYFVNGALNRDYTLVMGIVLFYGTLIILMNMIADILYKLLDPKIK